MYLATISDFKGAVADTIGGKPLIIDFTANWCPPCKRIGPIYEGLINNYPELTMKKIDVDANWEGSQAAGIKCMPTFKVYFNGAEVEKLQGANQEELIALLDRAKSLN